MEDEFDDGAPILAPAGRSGKKGASLSTEGAIRFIDEKWHCAIAKRGRWMDLIGDYAGSERFILDGKTAPSSEDTSALLTEKKSGTQTGEALFQRVLDDSLLALGREGGEEATDNVLPKSAV